MEDLGTIILATGALGTAAFGIVEILKGIVWVGDFGFGRLKERLDGFADPLRVAYGNQYTNYLLALYRTDHKELERVVRQGIRIGLVERNAAQMAVIVGVVSPEDLKAAVTFQYSMEDGEAELDTPDTDGHRRVLGRFELAVDARIDAAMTDALRVYKTWVRCLAVIVALGIAMGVAWHLERVYPVEAPAESAQMYFRAFLIGLAAVPIAPVAKDLAAATSAATRALGMRPRQ